VADVRSTRRRNARQYRFHLRSPLFVAADRMRLVHSAGSSRGKPPPSAVAALATLPGRGTGIVTSVAGEGQGVPARLPALSFSNRHPGTAAMPALSSTDDRLKAPYAAHLDTMSRRLEQALESGGLDALCVFAGSERFPDRDDVPYPFRIEPYFKAWVPLTDAAGSVLTVVPGRRPRVIYL